MERYNEITNKNQREIVLLQGRPCAWGKCVFCDYIADNSKDKDAMVRLNHEVLSRVTGNMAYWKSSILEAVLNFPKKH